MFSFSFLFWPLVLQWVCKSISAVINAPVEDKVVGMMARQNTHSQHGNPRVMYSGFFLSAWNSAIKSVEVVGNQWRWKITLWLKGEMSQQKGKKNNPFFPYFFRMYMATPQLSRPDVQHPNIRTHMQAYLGKNSDEHGAAAWLDR